MQPNKSIRQPTYINTSVSKEKIRVAIGAITEKPLKVTTEISNVAATAYTDVKSEKQRPLLIFSGKDLLSEADSVCIDTITPSVANADNHRATS